MKNCNDGRWFTSVYKAPAVLADFAKFVENRTVLHQFVIYNEILYRSSGEVEIWRWEPWEL